MFDEGVLRRIFGPEREEVAGGWRTLHSEELHSLYASPNIITVIRSRRMKWADNVERMGEMRNVYSILVGKPKGKRPFRRPRRRWKGNVRTGTREIGWKGVD
jgi:hypothetical protein